MKLVPVLRYGVNAATVLAVPRAAQVRRAAPRDGRARGICRRPAGAPQRIHRAFIERLAVPGATNHAAVLVSSLIGHHDVIRRAEILHQMLSILSTCRWLLRHGWLMRVGNGFLQAGPRQ